MRGLLLVSEKSEVKYYVQVKDVQPRDIICEKWYSLVVTCVSGMEAESAWETQGAGHEMAPAPIDFSSLPRGLNVSQF